MIYKSKKKNPWAARFLKVMLLIICLHLAILYFAAIRLEDSNKKEVFTGKINVAIVSRVGIQKVINEIHDPLKPVNIDKSIKEYTNEVEEQPENSEYRLKKAILKARRNRLKEAAAEIDTIKEKFPDKPEGYHGEAIIHSKNKEYNKALKDINTAIRMNPKKPIYYIDRGYIYYNMKNLKRSRIDFQTALRLEPENPLANYGMGEVYFKEDQLEKSAESLRKALKKDQRLPKAHLTLASVYFDQDKFRECLNEYFIELENIKLYGKKDDFHEGACLAEIARTLAMLDKPDEALEYIEKFKQSVMMDDMYEGEFDLSRSLIEDLGNAYIELAAHKPEYYVDALFNYRKTLEFADYYSNIDNFFHYFQCGWALWEMGKQDEAMKYFEEGLKWQPEHEARYEKWMRGHVLALQGKYDEALKYLNRALEMDPTFENAYFTRGLVYYLKGDDKKALEDLKKVEELRQHGEAIAIFHRKAMELKSDIEQAEEVESEEHITADASNNKTTQLMRYKRMRRHKMHRKSKYSFRTGGAGVSGGSGNNNKAGRSGRSTGIRASR